MKKYKIAIIALFKGGIGHYISQLSSYLAEDFDIEYISYKQGLPGDEVKLDDPAINRNIKNIHLVISVDNYKEVNESIFQTVKILKDKKIEILNVHIGTIARETSYLLIPIILIAKQMGIKIIYTFHDVEPFEEFVGGKELLKLLYLLADGATIGNKNEMKTLINKYGFDQKKLSFAPHGIYSIFDFNKYDKNTAKEHLNIPQDKKVILNFGILRPYKGFDDTIKAMPEILKKHPNAFLHISAGVRVFGGPENLQKLVEDLQLENKSRLIFDFVPSEEIEPIFKAAEIVVLPYKKVSQSGILNLALYFNKPIVLSDLFFEAKDIKDKLGIIISPGKPDLIAEAVNKLLSDKNLYNLFQENIKNYIKNDVWRKNFQSFRQVVEKAMNE